MFKTHVASKIEELRQYLARRDNYGYPVYYFGQSTWDTEAKRIFEQEYSDEKQQLADMLASLESNLEKYEEYMKTQTMDQADEADRRGQRRFKNNITGLIAKIKELLAQ
tara:strand:+ start:444 stop:770 length:327 start_codon:yes stop_codon:yes gene_type:complete